MPTIDALLKKLRDRLRQHVELEHEIADVERAIATAANVSKPRGKRSTSARIAEVVKATVKVLRDADGPLPRKEIATRLGISPSSAAYRVRKAVEAKFVEKVEGGRYRVAKEVPAF